MDMSYETSGVVLVAERTRPRIALSAELLAYAAILCFALLLRVADLDIVPLLPSETHNALAAWRAVSADAPGDPLIASSPAGFVLQSLSFAFGGASEFTARLPAALGGVLLILLPVLFRPLLGRAQAFLLSLLLAFSPVLLIASRSGSPDVWALLFAGLSLWGYWMAARGAGRPYAVAAVVMFAALVFLSGTGGLPLALILLGAGTLARLWERRKAALDEETPLDALAPLRGTLQLAFAVAVLVVFVVATGFMLYPAGLSVVGAAVGGAVRGVILPSGMNGYATMVTLYYETGICLIAVGGLIARRHRLTLIDRFLALWVVIGVIASFVAADGVPDHALWIVVPLTTLAAFAVAAMIAPERAIVFDPAPGWVRPLIAVCIAGVLWVFTVAFQSVARSLVQAPDASLAAATFEAARVVLLLVAPMFLIIGFFLFASLWGSGTTWRGVGLGVLIFGAVTSLGSGWNSAVTEAASPVDPWHMTATHGDTALLRETLFEVAVRVSRGIPAVPVTVSAPQDGIVAWVLRDFPNARFVTDATSVAGDEVLLLPAWMALDGEGWSYVGQDFTVQRSWDINSMNLIDIPAWWSQRQARTPWSSATGYNLWLRQDVYLGVSLDGAG